MSCGCYTVFGSYVKDPVDWPGHIFSMTTLITPEGDVTPTWKTRNIKRSQLMPGTEITTTTVEGLYDRFGFGFGFGFGGEIGDGGEGGVGVGVSVRGRFSDLDNLLLFAYHVSTQNDN